VHIVIDFEYKKDIFRFRLPDELYIECLNISEECRKFKNHKLNYLRYLNNVGKNNYQCFIPIRYLQEGFFLPYFNDMFNKAIYATYNIKTNYVIKIINTEFNDFMYDIWVNYCNKGDENTKHIHTNCEYAAIIFIKNENEITYFENGEKIKGKNGEMLVFRHDLAHWTKKQKNIKERITISFNISEKK